jgi:hypothetical protein
MPKPAEIVAALGDVSAIDSYATLRAEMVDLFTDLADWMKDRNDERQAQICHKMAATVETIPYDMLAEFGHNYNPFLISAFLFWWVLDADAPDYADAHDLVLTLLVKLRRIDLDHPDTQKAIELIKVAFDLHGTAEPASSVRSVGPERPRPRIMSGRRKGQRHVNVPPMAGWVRAVG